MVALSAAMKGMEQGGYDCVHIQATAYMPSVRVEIREFRANLSRILESKQPVTITRHSETLGVFVPAVSLIVRGARTPTKAAIEAARRTGEEMDAMIAAARATVEELIADFEKMRREKRAARLRP